MGLSGVCCMPNQELKAQLEENVGADPPLPVADAIALVAERKKEWGLPDTELIKARRRCSASDTLASTPGHPMGISDEMSACRACS